MIIGILSDTHGNLKRTAAAIKLLKEHAPAHIIHCGDIGSQSVLDMLAVEFAETATPITCVPGNVDGWNDSLYAPMPHVEITASAARLHLDGKDICVMHGHETTRLRSIIASGAYDLVFTGHTHQRADEIIGRTRVINPGALHRTQEPGFAILDTATDTLLYIDVF
jgi:putative phosphoesterase